MVKEFEFLGPEKVILIKLKSFEAFLSKTRARREVGWGGRKGRKG